MTSNSAQLAVDDLCEYLRREKDIEPVSKKKCQKCQACSSPMPACSPIRTGCAAQTVFTLFRVEKVTYRRSRASGFGSTFHKRRTLQVCPSDLSERSSDVCLRDLSLAFKSIIRLMDALALSASAWLGSIRYVVSVFPLLSSLWLRPFPSVTPEPRIIETKHPLLKDL